MNNTKFEPRTAAGVASGMTKRARVYLEAGTSPDDIYSGLMGAAMAIMTAQGMTKMQIANRLKLLVDQAQDGAFFGVDK